MNTATSRWIHSIQALASFSGGMSWPWHRGQSGHPMPEPVARTTTPIVTSSSAVTTLVVASFWNRVKALSTEVDRAGKLVGGLGSGHSSVSALARFHRYPIAMTSRFAAARVGMLAAAVALAAAACGNSAPSASTAASASATPAAGVFPLIISSEIAVGPNRVLFSFIDGQGEPIGAPDRTVAVHFTGPGGESVEAADGTFIWAIENVSGVYVTHADFLVAGAWTAT